jgi:hypothetical protein
MQQIPTGREAMAKPFQHIERAEQIIEKIHDEDYEGGTLNVADTLALARAHLHLAQAKMTGGQRA